MAYNSIIPNPFVYLSCKGNIVTYWVNGCGTGSFTKKDCAYLIRELYKHNSIDKETKGILLNELKALKRP